MVKYRPARPSDAAEMTRLALQAKAHWDYPEEWLQAWRPELTVSSGYIERRWARVAELDGQVIGFTAVSQRNGRCELDHLWVAPDAHGQGIGRELFNLAWKEARGRGLPLLVESDPYAAGFYEALDGRRIGIVVSSVLGQRRELPLFEFPSGR